MIPLSAMNISIGQNRLNKKTVDHIVEVGSEELGASNIYFFESF